MAEEVSYKRKRPKKKRNPFLRDAKNYAKKGIYGRGTHIVDDQYSYFIGILDAMRGGFEDVEQRVNMANNVFEQTVDQEVHLACNQIVCKALEALIGFVEEPQLERFFDKFGENFRPICSDPYASHVLQKMVEIAFLRGLGKESVVNEPDDASEASAAKRAKPDASQSEEQFNLETEFSDAHRDSCRQFVLRVSKFLLNNLEDFVWDSYANHIIRTSILSLAGVHVPKVAFDKLGAEMGKHRKLYKVPEEWTEVMKEFPQRLEMWPQFAEFPYQEHTSALLSIICKALRVLNNKSLTHFGKKILMEAFLKSESKTEDKKEVKLDISGNEEEELEQTDTTKTEESKVVLPKVFEYHTAVILLENLLAVAGSKLLKKICALLFTGRVALLAKEQLTNFAVQRLLENITEKEDFEAIFSELHAQTEELLKIGCTGVVSALASACLRLGCKQAQMISSLQSALHILGDKDKSKYFFKCLVKLKPYEVVIEDKSTTVNLQGSIIIQQILQYNKPIFLVNCILESEQAQLTAFFNTPNGSYIVDAFLQSKYIGEKSREKLIRHLEGFYVELAITRNGSRVVEQFFNAALDSQKARIAKELADKSNMLKSTPFGRIIHNKLRLETFNLSATQWKASLDQKLDKADKAKALFKDIIN